MGIDIISEGQRVFDIEIDALIKMRQAIDNNFVKIVQMITECKGKVIITGMGKPGHIASKIAATMSSLGTPSFFLHPAEALHGDLGMVSSDDVVIIISYSGESDEIINILPNLKMLGAKIISISGNEESTLVKYSDNKQILPPMEEACSLKLAPTSSTTAALVYGDALAVVASRIYGFSEENFGMLHPAGSLGKQLTLTVKDIMVYGDNNPIIKMDSSLTDAIFEMSKKGLGMVSIIDNENKVNGIITDGDLRRSLQKKIDIYSVKVNQVMTKEPSLVNQDDMAIEAFKFLKDKSINCVPVIDDNGILVGSITLQMLVKIGLIL